MTRGSRYTTIPVSTGNVNSGGSAGSGKLGIAGRARMAGEDQGASLEDIRRELVSRAREMWGEKRATEDSATIDDTARQLWDISQNLPHFELEPGFFQ